VILSIKYFPIKQQWSTKLLPRCVGPFPVVKRIGEVAYRLDVPSYLRIHDVFHLSTLKPYRSQHDGIPPPPPVFIDSVEEFEVDWIESTRFSGSRLFST
jgi:hypothetical protein